jgi:hypothetical protein
MALPVAASEGHADAARQASQSRNWLTERLVYLPQIRLVFADQQPYSVGSAKNSEDY